MTRSAFRTDCVSIIEWLTLFIMVLVALDVLEVDFGLAVIGIFRLYLGDIRGPQLDGTHETRLGDDRESRPRTATMKAERLAVT